MTAIETTTANAGRHASRSTRSSRRDDRRATLWADGIGTASVGGLVIGGDYQGLGIARSLGRLGVPVCVVDDEHSISRFSRYVEHSVRVKTCGRARTVDALLDVGRRLGLERLGAVPDTRRDRRCPVTSSRRARRVLPRAHSALVRRALGLGQAQHVPLAERARHPDS